MQIAPLLQLLQTYISMSTQSYFFLLKINEMHSIKFSKSFTFIYFPALLNYLAATKTIKHSVHS